jgi:hypothetical protein
MTLTFCACLLLCGQALPTDQALRKAQEARQRREAIEEGVARLGEECRPLLEDFEIALKALAQIRPDTAKALAGLYRDGCLPAPAELLACVAQHGHGDPVARFIAANHQDLADDNRRAFFHLDPAGYSLGLRSLNAVPPAAPARNTEAYLIGLAHEWRHPLLGAAGGIAALIVFGLLSRRKGARP